MGIYYCPFCGTPNYPKNIKCCHCKRDVQLIESKHEPDYYDNQSRNKYGDTKHWKEFVIEEAKNNPLYDQTTRDYQISDDELTANIKRIIADNQPPKPKCPTCGSTNIQKISDLRKAGGAILFGIFSKDAKSQFECRNCGFKW